MEKRESKRNWGLARVKGKSIHTLVTSPSTEKALAHLVLAEDMDHNLPPSQQTPTPRRRAKKMKAAPCGQLSLAGLWSDRIEGMEGHRRVARSGYQPAVAPRRHGVGLWIARHQSGESIAHPWTLLRCLPLELARQQLEGRPCMQSDEWRPNGQRDNYLHSFCWMMPCWSPKHGSQDWIKSGSRTIRRRAEAKSRAALPHPTTRSLLRADGD